MHTSKSLHILLLAAMLAAPGSAVTIDLVATDSGWHGFAVGHMPANPNYFAGETAAGEFRNFFVFDLSAVVGPIISAELRIGNGDAALGTVCPCVPETYDVFSISVGIPVLTAAGGPNSAAFMDIGANTQYGTFTGNPDPAINPLVVVPLTLNTALADINAGIGGSIAFGGLVSSITIPAPSEAFFIDGPAQTPPQVATLRLETAVPEPGTLISLLGGLLAVGAVVRRRRTKA